MPNMLAKLLIDNGYRPGDDLHLAVDVSSGMMPETGLEFLQRMAVALRELNPPAVCVYSFSDRLEHVEHFEQGKFNAQRAVRWTGGGTDLQATVNAAAAAGTRRLFAYTDGLLPPPKNQGSLAITYLINKDGARYAADLSSQTGDRVVIVD